MPSRRDLLVLLGAASLPLSGTDTASAASRTDSTTPHRMRVRTITAGVDTSRGLDLSRLEHAMDVLARGRTGFVQVGYEVETLRIATTPSTVGDTAARQRMLRQLETLDRLAVERGVIVSIGPVLTEDRIDAALPEWADELVRTTKSISFSVVIASAAGVHRDSAATAARMMQTLSRTLPDGVGNFRFAAAASIPAGTPFFPVAWHQGPDSLAIGLESASIVEEAARGAREGDAMADRVRAGLDEVLAPVARLAGEIAARERLTYLGIDASPAPARDRSIGAAIEAITRQPFGAAGTLEACASVTRALKSLTTKTCGYSGLMLPVLEDPLLAQRAGEGRFTIRDLLLYSSVCGTGLDVVPIPGDTPVDSIAALLRDVAAMSVRLGKPLSARLFVVPGKRAGEMARFTDPLLTDCVVMKVD